MKTYTYKYDTIASGLPDALYFDIETTGLSPKNSNLYLIGCGYQKDDQFESILFFSDDGEEYPLIEAFAKLCSSFDRIISFNGRTFDLPYLQEKCKSHQIEDFLSDKEHLDFYRLLLPFKKTLSMNSMRQKDLEQYLGIDREDLYSGKELIDIYRRYVVMPKSDALDVLLLHNKDDIYGLYLLSEMLALPRFMQGDFSMVSDEVGADTDLYGNARQLLSVQLQMNTPIAKPIHVHKDGIYLDLTDDQALLRITITQGQMYFFYPNPKDYWYFPLEDTAIHKSLAMYSDSTHRKKATSKTAYTRVEGNFIPQYQSEAVTYYAAPNKKEKYQALSDWLNQDTDQKKIYLMQLIRNLFKK